MIKRHFSNVELTKFTDIYIYIIVNSLELYKFKDNGIELGIFI